MKKAFVVVMTFCFMAGWSAAILVDNFDSYATGAVETVTTNWKIFAGQPTGAVTIAVDPANSSNKVLSIVETNYNSGGGGYGILSGSAIIANGETKTLFYRFRTNASSASALNTCLGLTDVAAPVANSWATQCTQHRFNLGLTMARNGGVWDPATGGVAIAADTWYNVWVQVNHAANTFKVYMNSTPGADGNPVTDRIGVATADAFRTSNTNDLVSFSFNSLPQGTVATILLDDINVVNGESLINQSMPLGANTPTPTGGASGVLISTTSVSWLTGVDPTNPANPNPNITKHFLYFVDKAGEPNLPATPTAVITASGSGASWTISPALVRDKTYTWRVDESLDPNAFPNSRTIKGSAWSFDTEKSIPVIVTQPVSVRVSTPASASFTTVFTSVSTPTVVWYKNGVSIGASTTLTNVGTTYTATKTFAPTADSDQADYYCVLSNTGTAPQTVTSNVADLVTKKLLAWYKFDGDLTDSSTFDPHNGTAGGLDPNITPTGLTYSTGIAGQAVVFNGSAIVDLGINAYPKGSFTGTTLIGTGVGLGAGMDEATISCWLKATSIGGLITNYNDNILANTAASPSQPAANTTGFGMELAGTVGDSRGHLRGELAGPPISESFVSQAQGSPVKTPPFNMLGDGKWHQIAVTWKQGDKMVAYTDGVQVASASAAAGTRDIFKAPQRGVVIGGIRAIADRAEIGQRYIGLMDDLQVYNYAKDKYGIADIYYAATGKGACIETWTPASVYDFDGNCKVDLADFAVLASNWLGCGRYPASTCSLP